MCDCWLMSSPNRLASAGKERVAHRFAFDDVQAPCWKSQGLGAVYIPQGARLLVSGIPKSLQV